MIYIGLDAHMSSCTFCVMNEKGVVIDQATLATNGRLLVDYIERFQGPKKLTLEECEISQWLYGVFKGKVQEVLVCNPVDNVQYKKGKTDKLDARRLTDLLRGGFLKSVYHDDSPRERFRIMVSAYLDQVQDIVRIKNRLKSIFRREGQKPKGEAFYRRPETVKCLVKQDARFIAEGHFGMLAVASKRSDALKEELLRKVKMFPEAKYLDSVPGLGLIQAAKIISQVVDPRRFTSKYQFFSYCALVRHKKISAGRNCGSRKATGNLILKEVYKMASHNALRGQGPMRQVYDSLRERGRSHKHASQAVARKIAAVSLAVWRRKQRFKPRKKEVLVETLG